MNTDNKEAEIDELSDIYIQNKVLQGSKKLDAIHVATCVLFEFELFGKLEL